MQVVNIEKGRPVAKRQEKVMEWYLIQTGSVKRHYNLAELTLGANAIIGILENTWFSCDYIASEDTTLIVIPCKDAGDLKALFKKQPGFRPIFLRTALEQRHQAIGLYTRLYQHAMQLHTTAQKSYNDYKQLCQSLLIPERSFYRIAHLEAPKLQHRVENWEIRSSASLMAHHLHDYLQLMVQNDDLCVGAIMEAAAQMHRCAQGIDEISDYLACNRDVLWNDNEDDIFHLYTSLSARLSAQNQDISACRARMEELLAVMKELNIYEPMQLEEGVHACHNASAASDTEDGLDLSRHDCISEIMSYAEYDKEAIRSFKLLLQDYKALPDRLSSDKEVRALRKKLSAQFYEIYEKAFFRSMLSSARPTPVLQMFFNFGFMDTELLGEEAANALLRFTESLGLFGHTHVYTIYEWLRQIYLGEKRPSRNDFDLDFNAYLQEQLRQGEITEREMTSLRRDSSAAVRFEIANLFQTTHRSVSGRLSTFCPILSADEVFGSFEKMAVTATRIEQALNRVRSLDYSLLYREVLFSDPEHGITQEELMHEVLPDFILLPVVGSRSITWQETSGPRTDTPARILFPIFITGELDDQMLLAMGRYRWEICRRIQGTYWNDYRTKSLTSEYYDYLQFYRKNKELSAEAKDKLKSAIAHARNNFREVFVTDYVNWIKYESQGSFRLNKITRDFLVRYCPFSKEIRMELSSNPLFQNAFNKLELDNNKTIKRLQAVYRRYEDAGGVITPQLTENLKFYQL